MSAGPNCKKGDRIELRLMPDDPAPVEPGTKGTVVAVTYMHAARWQVVVNWDNGRKLNLVWPIDEFRIIDGRKQNAEVAEEPLPP